MTDDDRLRLFTETDHGVLVTMRRDGRPQLSNVNHTFDPERRLLRVSITADRAKAKNLARELSSGVFVSRDGDGHTAFNQGNSCIDRIVVDYLVDGKVPKDGTSC